MTIKIGNKLITKESKYAKSFIDRSLGLLIPSNPKFLLFKTRFGIHTFFLKEPIDILILDKDFKVVKIEKSLKPYKIFFWNPKHFWILEAPKNTVSKYKVQVGTRLLFKNL